MAPHSPRNRDARRQREDHVRVPGWLRPGLATLVLLAGGASMPVAAGAQETGTTRVTVSVERDRFHIEIVLDPESLLTRLARRAQSSMRGAEPGGPSVSPDASTRDIAGRITTYRDAILRELTIQFDEKLAAAQLDEVVMLPGVSDATDQLSSPRAALRLSGGVPDRGRRFQWAYGLTYAPYVLTFRQGGVIKTAVIDGAQISPSFDLVQEPAARWMLATGWGVVFSCLVVVMVRRGRRGPQRPAWSPPGRHDLRFNPGVDVDRHDLFPPAREPRSR